MILHGRVVAEVRDLRADVADVRRYLHALGGACCPHQGRR